MQNVIKTRKEIFEKMLEYGDNAINWEMLCCSNKPLVPFIGAGVSSWCYPKWKDLLTGIVRKAYSDECVEYVNAAWECKNKPNVTHKDEFFWTEEIAECIFDEEKNKYDKNVRYHSLCSSELENPEDIILQKLRYYVGEESHIKKTEAVGLLYQEFADELLKEKGKVPEYQNYFPVLFPDILVTTNYDNALKCVYPSILSYSYTDLEKRVTENNENIDKEDNLETNINENKDACENAIDDENNLVSSINTSDSNVSKESIDNSKSENRSWLYYAVSEKLSHKRKKFTVKTSIDSKVTIPDMPMLLKVHGSIERASELALTKTGYDKAYNTEITELMNEIFEKSTLIFIGYGLSKDRIMNLLIEYKKNEKNEKNVKHFAFLSKCLEKDMEDLTEEYGVYPIYYDEN